MWKQAGKRLLVLLLAAALVLGALPIGAAAAGAGYSVTIESLEIPGDAEIRDALRMADAPSGTAVPYDRGDLYSQLTTRQKACYDALAAITFEQILSAAEVKENGVSFKRVTTGVEGIDGLGMIGAMSGGVFLPAGSSVKTESGIYTDLCAALTAFRYDRPDVLWLGRVRYGYKITVYQGNVKISGVTFSFHLEYDGKEREMREKMMANARAVADKAEEAADTYGKVLAVHDLLAENNSYGDDKDKLAHTAYSALVTDDGCQPVCDGYAKAVKVVLNLMDIPCAMPSTTEGDHRWNNVKMDDGDWYNLDLTWDDQGEELSHEYFLVGSRTEFNGVRFCDQKEHREENPYSAELKSDASGKLRPVSLRFPVKNRQAYVPIGRDYDPLTFPDVKRSAWYYDEVEDVSRRNLFHGAQDGLFLPDKEITRAEFAQVMANAAGADLTAYTGASYPDVTVGKWYAPAIAWAKEQKKMNGYKDGLFRPEAPITREEMCVAIRNFVGSSAEPTAFTFPDDGQISKWAREAVYQCHALGLVTGDDKGRFAPRDNTLRSQAAAIFSRISQLDRPTDDTALPTE